MFTKERCRYATCALAIKNGFHLHVLMNFSLLDKVCTFGHTFGGPDSQLGIRMTFFLTLIK